MKRKLIIICLMICISIILSACKRVVCLNDKLTYPEDTEIQETREKVTEEIKKELIPFVNTTEGDSNFKYIKVKIEVPEYADIITYYVYEKAVFYVVDYSDAIRQELIEFENRYSTQIRKYNMLTGEDELVYEFTGEAIRLYEICFNGAELIWEQSIQNNLGDWAIYGMNIDEEIPYLITDYSEYKQRNEKTVCIDLWLSENYIFWKYNAKDNADYSSLYRYDFDSDEVTELVTLPLRYPECQWYEDGLIALSYSRYSGVSTTLIYDENGNQKYSYEMIENSNREKCNSQIYVWIDNSEYNQICIYVRDLESNQCYKLAQQGFHEYAILDDYVIFVDDGLKSYRMGDVSFKTILEGKVLGLTLNNMTNEIFGCCTQTKDILEIISIYLETS